MRRAAPVAVSSSERRELRRWTRVRGRPRRLAVRARIVLEAAKGRPNSAIAARLGVAPETVARWRERFLATGLEGLRREAPRAGAARRVPHELVGEVLNAQLDRPRSGRTGWSTRSLARALNTNHMTVHRILRNYGLSNERAIRTSDAPSATRVDLVGVFQSSRGSAIVFGLEGRAGRPPERTPASVPVPMGAPDLSGPDPSSAIAELVVALRASGAEKPPSAVSGPAPATLLVFLRSIEQRTPPTARLDAIFDRPLAVLGGRVVAWLDAHPRYRVYTTGSREEWIRSAETWFRRWENVRLDVNSFASIQAFRDSSARVPPGLTPQPPRPTWTGGQTRPRPGTEFPPGRGPA
ncbi:MAG: helix-turn-helix domain-containing protein [Thermoplasmata archaeon]